MRIQLVLQVFQFRFRLLSLRFYQPLFRHNDANAGWYEWPHPIRQQKSSSPYPAHKISNGAEYDVQTQEAEELLTFRNT